MNNNPLPDNKIYEQTEIVSHPTQFGIGNILLTIISVSIVVATLLTLWTPGNLLSTNMIADLLMNNQVEEDAYSSWPTLTPSAQPIIGIVAGHWGNDSGTVCSDGLTEVEINLKIATLIKQFLIAEGYDVNLLQEFDPLLYQFQALALISIHNDSCEYVNDEATGFKVAAAQANVYPEKANRLTACLVDRYAKTTGLKYHANTITPDMTSYHALQEIHSNTTAAIIETGFMNLDRQILTEQTELVARGVTDGILCYVRNEQIPQQ